MVNHNQQVTSLKPAPKISVLKDKHRKRVIYSKISFEIKHFWGLVSYVSSDWFFMVSTFKNVLSNSIVYLAMDHLNT